MIILPTSGTVRVWAVPLILSLLVLPHPAKGQNKQTEQSGREQLRASGTATNSLQQLLKRFPKADKNQDGRLTWAELNQYRKPPVKPIQEESVFRLPSRYIPVGNNRHFQKHR